MYIFIFKGRFSDRANFTDEQNSTNVQRLDSHPHKFGPDSPGGASNGKDTLASDGEKNLGLTVLVICIFIACGVFILVVSVLVYKRKDIADFFKQEKDAKKKLMTSDDQQQNKEEVMSPD